MTPTVAPQHSATDTPPAGPPDRLAALVTHARDAIFSIDLAHRVETWNHAATIMFGYSGREMIGQSATDVLVPDNERDDYARAIDAVLRDETVEPLRSIRMRKDGRRIVTSTCYSSIRGNDGRITGISQIVRDLTLIAERENVFEAIITSSDDAIVGKDLRGIVHSWNQGAERMFGYSADEMIGQSIVRLMPPGRESEEKEILTRLGRGERVDHFQTVRRHKSGRLIDVSVTISPILSADGRVVGASKIARDITVARRMAAEREQLLANERAARLDAEQANRAKDEFLATLSHELRTPLNAILGWTQLLRIGSPTRDEIDRAMHTIDRNARAQTQLIEELLDISRIVSGNMRLHLQHTDLRAIVTDTLESMRPAAQAKGIELSAEVGADACLINADAGRLQQVVWNLLSNAVRYTPHGGRVDVVLTRDRRSIRLTVRDTGQGIAPEFLPKLFTRFAQQDASTTRRHGGLGLGLAIVRHLVELHGGSVWADSPGVGKGATFTIELPLGATPEPPGDDAPRQLNGAAVDAMDASAAVRLDTLRVLVVDDQEEDRYLIRRLLEARGAVVLAANSAAEAFDLLVRERPNLLISDIGMPDEDGFTLVEKIRRLDPDKGGQTPAVALTAFVGPEQRRRALAAGFDAHLAKPVEAGKLFHVIARATAHH